MAAKTPRAGMKNDFDVAIVGGGAAGVLLALRLLHDARAGQRIALIEPDVPGRGAAYATEDPAHLLNVPAGNMGADAGAPGDFVDYLRARDGDADPTAFRPRRDYADYLQARLHQARQASAVEFRHVRARAVHIQWTGSHAVIHLDARAGVDATLHSRRVVLATGNQPRTLAADNAHPRILSAWQNGALERIAEDDDIAILGSGLSMVDALLSLDARGHRGRVVAISRHGLLPLAHPDHRQTLAFDTHALEALPLRRRLRVMRETARRAAADGIGWQALMDALRHHGRTLWQSLDTVEQRRFLRHAVRHWDVHRHRVAPQVARLLQRDLDRGRLERVAARVHAIDGGDGRVALMLHERGTQQPRMLAVDWLVNATGIETRAAAFTDPLLRQLLADGLARPGPHGLGFDCAADGAVLAADGRAQPWLCAIGSLRLGNLWESTAIPDLRVDAAMLAPRLLAAA